MTTIFNERAKVINESGEAIPVEVSAEDLASTLVQVTSLLQEILIELKIANIQLYDMTGNKVGYAELEVTQ